MMSDVSLFLLKEVLDKRFYGNRKFYKEMVTLFLETSKEKVDSIKQAILSGNMKETQFPAHYIKGGAANIGAFKISALAEQIELLDGDNNLNTAGELLESLIVELNKFREIPSQI